MTDAEQALWRVLRRRQVEGFRFRRQHPIGPYIADFACLEAKLVVEVDGGQHDEQSDAQRAGYLAEQGYRVVRYWNHEVLGRLDAVAEEIRRVLLARVGGEPTAS